MILLILANLLSYSQDLRPDRLAIKDGDTLFCWNIDKSRTIAKKLTHQEYCDSIAKIMESKIADQDSIISTQKEYIEVIGLQKKNLQMTVDLNEQEKAKLKHEIRRQNIFKWGAFSLFALYIVVTGVM